MLFPDHCSYEFLVHPAVQRDGKGVMDIRKGNGKRILLNAPPRDRVAEIPNTVEKPHLDASFQIASPG